MLAEEATAVLGGRIDILINNRGIYPIGPTADVSDEALVASITPVMVRRGGGSIDIGSWIGSLCIGHSAPCGDAKVALEKMSRPWAAEYSPTPAGRPGTPSDIANAVVFLASDAASFIHAATLSVAGCILNTASR